MKLKLEPNFWRRGVVCRGQCRGMPRAGRPRSRRTCGAMRAHRARCGLLRCAPAPRHEEHPFAPLARDARTRMQGITATGGSASIAALPATPCRDRPATNRNPRGRSPSDRLGYHVADTHRPHPAPTQRRRRAAPAVGTRPLLDSTPTRHPTPAPRPPSQPSADRPRTAPGVYPRARRPIRRALMSMW